MENEYVRRGVKTKLFGFIIMALGVLDILLNLRGGLPAYEKFIFLILFGACVFAIGAVRSGKQVSDGQGIQAGGSGTQ
ncbi:MAG: hypothetical protein WC091_00515 [Sulfuricellaceae bacterium]